MRPDNRGSIVSIKIYHYRCVYIICFSLVVRYIDTSELFCHVHNKSSVRYMKKLSTFIDYEIQWLVEYSNFWERDLLGNTFVKG